MCVHDFVQYDEDFYKCSKCEVIISFNEYKWYKNGLNDKLVNLTNSQQENRMARFDVEVTVPMTITIEVPDTEIGEGVDIDDHVSDKVSGLIANWTPIISGATVSIDQENFEISEVIENNQPIRAPKNW